MYQNLTLIVNWKEKTIHVNGYQIKIDKIGDYEGDGILDIELLTAKENPIAHFDAIVGEMAADSQLAIMYNFCSKSNTITISGLALAMGVTKEAAKQIINDGLACGVFVGGRNCSWKVAEKIIKERMLLNARALQERSTVSTKPRTQEEILKSSIAQSKAVMQSIRETEEEEETIHDPDRDMSVKDSMMLPPVKKPSIPGPVRKIQKPSSGKPALSKPLGHKPKAR